MYVVFNFRLDAEDEFENKIYMCISHMEWQQWLLSWIDFLMAVRQNQLRTCTGVLRQQL